MSEKYLGRTYDEKTMTWSYSDGSGELPHEAIVQYKQDLEVLGYKSIFGLMVAAKNKENWAKRLTPPSKE